VSVKLVDGSLSTGGNNGIPFNRWAFNTDEGDIAFAVYRKKDGQLIELVPRERVDSHVCVEEGELICDDAGLCEYNPLTAPLTVC
jgi:hypothetical protein